MLSNNWFDDVAVTVGLGISCQYPKRRDDDPDGHWVSSIFTTIFCNLAGIGWVEGSSFWSWR